MHSMNIKFIFVPVSGFRRNQFINYRTNPLVMMLKS